MVGRQAGWYGTGALIGLHSPYPQRKKITPFRGDTPCRYQKLVAADAQCSFQPLIRASRLEARRRSLLERLQFSSSSRSGTCLSGIKSQLSAGPSVVTEDGSTLKEEIVKGVHAMEQPSRCVDATAML